MALASVLILSLLAVGSEGPEMASEADCLQQAEAALDAGLRARANAAESRRHFQKAAKLYQVLSDRGVSNEELYRNLGNAYWLAGDLPRAILAYRRGLRLAPGDAELLANLNHARSQVVYSEPVTFGRPPVDNQPAWLPTFNPHVRLGLTVLLASLGWTLVFRWWMLRGGSMLEIGVLLLAAAGVLTATLVAEDWRNRQDMYHPVVVVAEDGVLLRKGNGLTYPRRYDTPLHRGVEGRLIFAKGNWLQIELTGGEVGWVPRAYALVDS
jgi:tetratricopeptide (TPR) repeat protein